MLDHIWTSWFSVERVDYRVFSLERMIVKLNVSLYCSNIQFHLLSEVYLFIVQIFIFFFQLLFLRYWHDIIEHHQQVDYIWNHLRLCSYLKVDMIFWIIFCHIWYRLFIFMFSIVSHNNHTQYRLFQLTPTLFYRTTIIPNIVAWYFLVFYCHFRFHTCNCSCLFLGCICSFRFVINC